MRVETMQIQIILQVKIPEIKMIEPKVTVRTYNAKTWRDHKPDQNQRIPPIHFVTTMGVVGCSSWCATGVYVGERLDHLYARSAGTIVNSNPLSHN